MSDETGRVHPVTLMVGVLLGIVLLGTARYFAQPPAHNVHYHANWAVFIDGERLDLSANRYMEDVLRCTADPGHQAPEDRVHMHDSNPDVVHVHASGATWGHLLMNLGFGIGDDYLETDSVRYEADTDTTLKFILNGTAVRTIRNRQIDDSDRLLISYGAATVEEAIDREFPAVATTAPEFNVMPDPASCSGQAEATFGERIRRAFWF